MILDPAILQYTQGSGTLDQYAVAPLRKILDDVCREHITKDNKAKKVIADPDMRERCIGDDRPEVINAFGRITDVNAVPELIDMLRDGNENSHHEAAFRAFAGIGSDAFPRMTDHIHSISGPSHRTFMESMLATAHPDAVTAVISYIGREDTLKALGRLCRRMNYPGGRNDAFQQSITWEVAERFLDFVHHPDKFLRSDIADLLETTDDPRSLRYLADLRG